MTHIYLDDLRHPTTDRGWRVVRSARAFRRAVQTHGFPQVVSFDHDLGEEGPSGYDCARWLVDEGIARGVDPHTIEWNVHSANPVGAANIRGLYTSWCTFWRMTAEEEE